jgi:hypothetical protein
MLAFPVVFLSVLVGNGTRDAFAFIPAPKREAVKIQRTKSFVSHTKLHSTTEDSDIKKNDEPLSKDELLYDDLLWKLASNQLPKNEVMTAHPMMKPEMQLVDGDFVLTTKYQAEKDPSVNLLSSELSVWKNLRKVPEHEVGVLPLDIILQRTWDTVEDIWQHLRRVPVEKGWAELSPESELTRKTIVVLGSGWGAHALLKVADCQKLRLIVISPSNHFVFTPMLASAAVGTVEYRSMTEAVRAANPMIDQYIEGKAVAVNVTEKYVDVQLNSLLDDFREGTPPTIRVDYDHLVCSVGSRVDDRGVPGADRALRLKSCEDARRLRTAVGECLEYASRPDCRKDSDERTKRATFLIVGG